MFKAEVEQFQEVIWGGFSGTFQKENSLCQMFFFYTAGGGKWCLTIEGKK